MGFLSRWGSVPNIFLYEPPLSSHGPGGKGHPGICRQDEVPRTCLGTVCTREYIRVPRYRYLQSTVCQLLHTTLLWASLIRVFPCPARRVRAGRSLLCMRATCTDTGYLPASRPQRATRGREGGREEAVRHDVCAVHTYIHPESEIYLYKT